jgi:hypothetical protein
MTRYAGMKFPDRYQHVDRYLGMLEGVTWDGRLPRTPAGSFGW